MFLRHVRPVPGILGGAAALAMLGACGQEAPSPEKVRQEAARLPLPEPGRYRTETRLTRFELPNAPAHEARLLRDRMAGVQPQVREFCLTPEEARRGFEPLLKQLQDGACRMDSFVVNSGRLRAVLNCTAAGGVTSHIAMEGMAQPRESRIALSIRQQSPAVPGGQVSMTMDVQSRWTGSC